VPLGAVVNLTARLVSANGTAIPARFLWNFGIDSGSYRAALNWTFSSVSSLASNGSFPLLLNATATTNGTSVEGRFWLPGFAAVEAAGFTPRTDALALSDRGGPPTGPTPLAWTGNATVGGPGTSSVVWEFGDGSQATQLAVQHSFAVGLYSVLLAASDSWGDAATDVFPVAATGALALTATLSTLSGSAPLSVAFNAFAAGGVGPPFQYLWSFGDSTQAAIENTSHTFSSVGTYHITLNVTDSGRDSARQNWTVTVTAASGSFPSAVLLIAGGAAGVAVAVIAVRGRRSRPGGTVNP
jgi:PKD repeat protein